MVPERRETVRGAGVWRRGPGGLLLAGAIAVCAGSRTPPLTAQSAPAARDCGESLPADGRPGVRVCAAAGEIEVDGRLDDPGWRGAARVELPFETFPGNNSAARAATTCLVTFDRLHLFLGCQAADSEPGGLRAFFAPRDELDGQDRIGFMLDPFDDARRAYEFVVSPLGVQADGVFDQVQGSVDPSWDAIWRSAGRLTETGYTVEAAIPFKSIRFPAVSRAQQWGFYAWRLRPRSESVETRSVPLNRGNGCLLCQGGRLVGLAGIAPGRNLQFSPTLTGQRSDGADGGGGGVQPGEVDVDAGLDARWSPSSNLAIALTLNPDFSQVEADVAQLEVNNRFALFFPEKRPFFLEGAELHSTPIPAVFTRTISNPTFGARLAGKTRGTAAGVLLAGDRINNLLLPGNQGSSVATVDAGVTTAIVRVRQDVGATAALGLLATGREGNAYHNRVVGADAFLQPLPPLSVRLQLLHSHTDYPDSFAASVAQPQGGVAGEAALAQINYDSRTWRGQVLGRVLDPGFRADAGFVEQVDLRELNAWGQRQLWGGPGRWLARINLTGGVWSKWRSDGLRTERVFWGNVLYQGPAQLRVFLDYQRRQEFFQGTDFALDRYRAELGMSPSGGLALSLAGRTGDAIDLVNAERVWQARLSSSARVRLGRHLDLNLSHAVERLTTRGRPIVTEHLPQLEAVCNWDRRLSLQATLQYRITERNPAAFGPGVDARRRHLFGRLLLAYEADPQTLVYLGYTDDRDGITRADGTGHPVRLTGRVFFAKLSYAWRP